MYRYLKWFMQLLIMIPVLSCRLATTNHFISPESSDEKVIIKGMLENGKDKSLYIEKMGATEFIPLDTVNGEDDGKFYFEFRAGQTDFYALRCFEQGYVTLLIEPGEIVEFSGNYFSVHPYSVSGSKGSELINQLAAEHKKTINAMAEISRKNRESIAEPNYQEIKAELDRKFDSLASVFYEYSLRFIYEHSESLSILIALYNQYGYGLPVFNPESDVDVFRFVDSSLSKRYPDNEALQLLHAQIELYETGVKDTAQFSGPGIGDRAPDFVMNDSFGNPVVLSEFRGNYLLLSFWAAWSKPCREENKVLKSAYSIFNKSGFEILQISLDDNKMLWVNAIKEDSLNWHHAGDLRRWESKAVDLYAVGKIPSNFLISPDGTIIGVDLFDQDLINKLYTIYN